MWLNLTNAMVCTTDISDREETINAGKILKEKYPDRFMFVPRDKLHNVFGKFDLAFIDGGHNFEDVFQDIEQCMIWGIKYLLFDDIYPRFGPGVMQAINLYSQLELELDMNNLRLYKCNQK